MRRQWFSSRILFFSSYLCEHDSGDSGDDNSNNKGENKTVHRIMGKSA